MPQDRLQIIAPIPSSGDRLHVAIDVRARPPRAVVLALYPPAIADDPARLARLAADVEHAARLHHPNILAPVGLEPVGERLAAATVWRDVVTVRELLQAGGRLPPDVAVRVALDVCAGLAHAHGRPEPVVHGAIRPEAVLVAPDGVSVISGFGMPGDATPADDVRAVAAFFYECIAREPPADPPRPLDGPGVPAALAVVIDRALARDRASQFASVDALADALASGLPPAHRDGVAAYAEAIVPVDEGARAERRRLLDEAIAAASRAGGPEEVSDDAILGTATPVADDMIVSDSPALPPAAAPAPAAVPAASAPLALRQAQDERSSTPTAPAAVPVAAPAPAAVSVAAPAPAAVPAAPPAARRRSPVPLVIAVVMGLGGIALGLWVSRTGFVLAIGGDRTARVVATPPPAPAAAAPMAAPAPDPAPHGEAAAAAYPEHKPAAADSAPGSIAIAAEPAGEIWVDGRRVGRSGTTIPVPRGPRMVRLRDPAHGLDVRKRVDVRGIATPVRFDIGRGKLDVTAPDAAEVLVDGRPVGRGNVHVELYEGDHRVDVRLGTEKVGERFHVGSGENYTYAVTPTPK